MSELPKGKNAVIKHVQDIFYGFPVHVVSITEHLNDNNEIVEIADMLISESLRRDGESE